MILRMLKVTAQELISSFPPLIYSLWAIDFVTKGWFLRKLGLEIVVERKFPE